MTRRRQRRQRAARVEARPGADVDVWLRVELVARGEADPDTRRVTAQRHHGGNVEMVRPAAHRAGAQGLAPRLEFVEQVGCAGEPARNLAQLAPGAARVIRRSAGDRVIGNGVGLLRAARRPQAQPMQLRIDPRACLGVGPALELEGVDHGVATQHDEREAGDAQPDADVSAAHRERPGHQGRQRGVPVEARMGVVGDRREVGARRLGSPLQGVVGDQARIGERRGRRAASEFGPVEAHRSSARRGMAGCDRRHDSADRSRRAADFSKPGKRVMLRACQQSPAAARRAPASPSSRFRSLPAARSWTRCACAPSSRR